MSELSAGADRQVTSGGRPEQRCSVQAQLESGGSRPGSRGPRRGGPDQTGSCFTLHYAGHGSANQSDKIPSPSEMCAKIIAERCAGSG